MKLSAFRAPFLLAGILIPAAVVHAIPPPVNRPVLSTSATIADLRCEYLTTPLTVDAAAPRFSWKIRSNERNWMQSAYRIWVASSPEALKKRADVWDSGEVASSQSLNIRYGGRPLTSNTRYYWCVRVWDRRRVPLAVVPVSFWQTGLLKPADWTAQWISAGTPRDTKADGIVLPPSPYLRKVFTLNKPVKRATVFATARGVYDLHLNGAKVSDELLAPGWTDYRVRTQYQAYDVTSRLKPGANAIGAVLGDGWFGGYVGWGQRRGHYGEDVALLLQLQVDYADGTRQVVGTDTSWQGSTGPIEYSDLLMGERYDARKANSGWDTAGYDATTWRSAQPAPVPSPGLLDVTTQVRAEAKDGVLAIVAGNQIAGDPAFGSPKQLKVEYTLDGVERSQTVDEGITLRIPAAGETPGPLVIRSAVYGASNRPMKPSSLVGSHGPSIRVTQEIKPIKITQPQPGNYVVDLGQNMVGVARLKVQGPAGTEVKLRFGEMLNPDGTGYTANLRKARATDTYVLSGQGVETWQPRFTFHGFRYVEVTGFPGTPGLDAITGCVIGSDTPRTGTFRTSNPLVNQLQDNIDWGQRGNFLSVPTDCPQRDERLGWMGDAQVFVRTATYNRDVASFFTKWLQDVEDAQGPDGAFSDVSPRKVDDANGAPAWGDAGVIVPWTVYHAYGDTEVINRHWDAMERWMGYIGEANPDGLWKQRRANDFGDWLSIRADTPKEVLATAYYAYDASLMADMARATGRQEAAAKYDALFEFIKKAFNAAYVTPDGRIQGDTQTCYLLGLRFKLLPEELRPLAAKHLADDIAAKNNHLSTGFVGVGYLCPVLSDTGNNDLAYKLLLNDTFPSWGYSIRRGATTIWERWDGWTEEKGFQSVGMNSFNHYSLGSVGEWLYRYVAGIDTDPRYPGFERIIIRPYPGPGLDFAQCSYESVRGQIVSNWKRENGELTLEVTVPANTLATVYVPAADVSRVREGNVLAKQVTGVKFLRQEGDRTVFEVGSGSYVFRVK